MIIVETACGECQLGLNGKSCDLAVRINGKANLLIEFILIHLEMHMQRMVFVKRFVLQKCRAKLQATGLKQLILN